jgi:CheY-like chemotaxis protein
MEASIKNLVVSIIDDDASVREGAIDLLNSAGFAAAAFESADQFLRSGQIDDACCIVADIRMPGTSGLEIPDHLLKMGKNIPTILITAFPKESDRIRALESGVNGYLSKPFSGKDLLSCVSTALSSQREGASTSVTPPSPADTPARSLHIEELDGPAALEMIAYEWDQLDAEVSPRTPFTSATWAKLWWLHVRQARPTICHEFFVHVVRDRTGKLLAIVPLLITHRPAYGPVRVRILQFFGAADGSLTEHRRIICREEDEANVVQALAEYLLERKDHWDVFAWTGIRCIETVPDRLRNLLKVFKIVPEYRVPLPDSWQELRSLLSPNTKEAIRKCYKHLARDGHSFNFSPVMHPELMSAALDRFLTLHAQRAQLAGTIKHRDYFAQASHRAFIIDAARHWAERNQLVIFELEIDGKVVASRMAFLLGDELYLYYSGYDLAWRKYSIMTTLMCECFKWAIERRIKIVNLSKGKDRSKLRWRGNEVMFHDALLMSPTWRGRLISRVFDFLNRKPGRFAKLTERT